MKERKKHERGHDMHALGSTTTKHTNQKGMSNYSKAELLRKKT